MPTASRAACTYSDPLNITYLFDKVKQFGFHGRQAGGVVAEEALWDIAGKVCVTVK